MFLFIKNCSRLFHYRIVILIVSAILLPVSLCISIAVGAVPVPFGEVIRILCGYDSEPRFLYIIRDIRLPQALAAILAGAGLSVSGATMQSVLRNPLCSPFTLGISSAAAFGAALMLYLGGGGISLADNMLFSSNHFFFTAKLGISLGAFFCAVLTTAVVLLLGQLRATRSESIILVGVALSSLFSAALMFLQYIADNSQLAAIVYWTFGDTARATWNSLILMAVCILPVSFYFLYQSWNYNALILGEESARSLGVPVRRLQTLTMLFASLLTAVLVSLLGIIGFVGLVVPHVARLWIGSDHRFLLPFSLLFGGLLLLIADTSARLIFAPRILPVSILTAFIGVPVFLSLLLGKRN
ncbi:MAG: iron ABC transporter permease [Planctomycetaceae bacterium]|jgi:iron complex transport system permease protein|nr:iron ABC transporter permease [Planctomycetaceae bacterium]